jgi:WD40 repeat protein
MMISSTQLRSKSNSLYKYSLRNLASHLYEIEDHARLSQLLMKYSYVQEKTSQVGIESLINDYCLAEAVGLHPIRRVLQQSAHILAQNSDQLWTQLQGRLMTGNTPESDQLLSEGESLGPWLCPLFPSLTQTNDALLRTIPTGHGHDLRMVVLTPDGAYAATASFDRNVKIWDLEAGREIGTLTGHSASVNALAMTPDGTRVVTGCLDGTITVWNISTQKPICIWTGNPIRVNGIAISANGQRVVTGSDDGVVKVWHVSSHQEEYILSGHASELAGVALTPDGRLAVTTAEEGPIYVWDLTAGTMLYTLTGHSKRVAGIGVSADGKRAVSVSWDKTIRIWDLEVGQCLQIIQMGES